MTEDEFAAMACDYLLATGNVVLRVSDKRDARHKLYGLRIVGPRVDSTGPDYLVLRRGDIPVVRTGDMDDVRAYARHRGGPVFLELKRPGARPRPNEAAQNEWIRIVGGARL